MIKDTEQWTSAVREVSLLPGAPIQQKDGRWKVAERLEAWKALGPRMFDEHLDKFRKVAVEVLRERDPQFELPPDQRYAASIHGKVLKHSHSLRNGLAETLALLGSYPEYLTSCSRDKAEATAILAVREILEGADWELWASLNDVLPLLAEAAPKEFLGIVENALNSDPCPFDGVFAQEGGGFSGRNYMTGLLWALEALAWDEEHLTRVFVILGELAARDPGGNWANRPANSLWTILLPWFPQTLAPIAKRVTAVATLQKEQPDVAWKLLINLLPQTQQSTSMSHKPTWRKFVPDGWKEGATNRDYWEQITAYSEMAVNQAIQDRAKLATIVDHLNQLPPAARQKLIAHLGSDEVVSLPEEERLSIWNELTDFVTRHRKFSHADWALPSDEINQIAAIAARLEPADPVYKYRRLFVQRDFDLYEETDDYAEQAKKLLERRQDAVREIHSQGGVQAVIEFADRVETPGQVGFAFGAIAPPEDEPEILPGLFEAQSSAAKQFAAAFILGRFQTSGWQWVDGLDMIAWTSDQKAALLAYLPFTSETWSRAKRILGDQEAVYWSKAQANPYNANHEELTFAIDRLVENNRVLAALDALERLLFNKGPIKPEQVVRVLNVLLQSPDSLRAMDAHAVARLIRKLQEDLDTNQDELFRIEWAFLALLDGNFGVSPSLLQKRLANDPAFFCEIIRSIFRSEKEAGTAKEVTEEQKAIATNAYRLLMAWKIPPGSQDDGTFDGDALNTWLDKVKAICAESGHLKIAMQQVGKVLFYSPPNPDGLWIHIAAASVLNDRDASDMRRGYEIETVNSRGVHTVDPEGKPERELARNYRARAEDVEIRGYYRLATTLREVAESYDREAEQNASRFRHDV
jgi:hypothetical protein